MADSKTSALPAATLPLGGTDYVMVAQGGESRRVAGSALGGGAATHPGYSTGRYYTANPGSYSSSPGIIINSGTVIYHPIILGAAVSVWQLCVNLIGGANTGSCLMGIYASANGLPTTRLATSTAVSFASGLGNKVFQFTTPIALSAGVYWAATLFDQAGGGAGQYLGVAGFPGWAVGGQTWDYAGVTACGLYQSQAFASGLPTTASGLSTMGTTGVPAVHFRVI